MHKYLSLFWRSLKSPLGLFGTFVLLFKPIKGAVAWMGDLEFVVEYWPQAMTFLDTGFGFTATVVGGALIISCAVFNAAREQPVGQALPQPPPQTLPREATSKINPNWARVDVINLWQAACIYEGIEPAYEEVRSGSQASGTIHALMSAVVNNKINVHKAVLKSVGKEWTQIKSADFIKFCKDEWEALPKIYRDRD